MYNVKCLFGFCLVPESDESSDGFPISHMMTKRLRNQTKFRYIIVPYGQVFVLLRVPLRILQLIDRQEPVASY